MSLPASRLTAGSLTLRIVRTASLEGPEIAHMHDYNREATSSYKRSTCNSIAHSATGEHQEGEPVTAFALTLQRDP
jgi:hypothetical protein